MNRLLDHQKMRQLVEGLIYVPPEMVADMNDRARLSLKLDCLEQLIHQIRGAYGCFDLSHRRVWSPVTVGEHQGGPLLEFFPQRYEVTLLARKPDRLIGPLLQFLYRTEVAGLRVRTIIEAFLRHMGNKLEGANFDFLASGGMRVVTMTRFAAHRMRKAGLLLATPAERYRTWRLSLPGLLVAHWLEGNAMPYAGRHEGFVKAIHDAWMADPLSAIDALSGMPSLCTQDAPGNSEMEAAVANWAECLTSVLRSQPTDRNPLRHRQLQCLFRELAIAPVAVLFAQAHAGFDPNRPRRRLRLK